MRATPAPRASHGPPPCLRRTRLTNSSTAMLGDCSLDATRLSHYFQPENARREARRSPSCRRPCLAPLASSLSQERQDYNRGPLSHSPAPAALRPVARSPSPPQRKVTTILWYVFYSSFLCKAVLQTDRWRSAGSTTQRCTAYDASNAARLASEAEHPWREEGDGRIEWQGRSGEE